MDVNAGRAEPRLWKVAVDKDRRVVTLVFASFVPIHRISKVVATSLGEIQYVRVKHCASRAP